MEGLGWLRVFRVLVHSTELDAGCSGHLLVVFEGDGVSERVTG